MYVYDTPGVMLPKITDVKFGLNLCLIGAIKDDIVGYDVLVEYMLHVLNESNLHAYVNVCGLSEPTSDIYSIFKAVVRPSNGLGKPQEVQYELAAKYVLKLFRNGKFGKLCLEEQFQS